MQQNSFSVLNSPSHTTLVAFNQTLSKWLDELNSYTFNQLCIKPSPTAWSLGQVYMHVLETAHYHLSEIQSCLASDEHATESASENAKVMFGNNDFPDMLIEGPPSNDETPQPDSIEQLRKGLEDLKFQFNAIADTIERSKSKGKTKHPGLHYFNAREWFQFAEMHMRHHLRQKKWIDRYLNDQ